MTESAEYGELLIEHYGWGNNATGKDYGMSYSLQNHFCSDEELGYVQGPKTRAFPVYKHSQRELNNYRKKFKCIDEEDMKIWGDFNSAKAMQLQIKFQMCVGTGCKSEQEIKKWLRDKYIVVIYNERRF